MIETDWREMKQEYPLLHLYDEQPMKASAATLARRFYRTKLAVSRYIPNKDNLPYCLLNERQIENRLQQAREELKTRRLIFTISPGRAGSEYLATLLRSAENVHALHEPLPRMNGRILEMAMSRPPGESYVKRRIKLLGINRALSRLDSDTIYAETSHMFIKSFHDVVLDYYENVEVIILRRQLHKVLKSFVELGFFSDINPVADRWMHKPGSANSATELLRPLDEMDQYEKCIAYLLDIEGLARAFRTSHPDIKTHEITLDGITESDGARRLFQDLGAIWTPESDRLYSGVVNRKTAYRSAIGVFAPEEYCKERLNQYIQQAQAAGKSVPDIKAV
jgi:hypothetical protein